MHGGDPVPESCTGGQSDNYDEPSVQCSKNDDGSISCPPAEMGGCGGCLLELKRILPRGRIPSLEKKATKLLGIVKRKWTYVKPISSEPGAEMLRRAASREGSDDNDLYCPDSVNIQEEKLLHFQKRWVKGEPVIVRNVLEKVIGLSWEPMVMWRALCENVHSAVSSDMSEVKAIDCLACCQVCSVIILGV